jgi:SecD/SecF fusion protein
MFGMQLRCARFRWLSILVVALSMAVVVGGSTDLGPSAAVAQQLPSPDAAPATPPTEQGATKVDASQQLWLNFFIVVALFAGSIAAGQWIARWAKLPEQSTRMSVIVFAVAASSVVTILGFPPRLGIDLSGGVILIYDIDKSQMAEGETLNAQTIDKLVVAVAERVNPGGVREVTVRPYGSGQVEIIIPEPRKTAEELKAAKNDDAEGMQSSEELERIKDIISQTGALEFRILADRRSPGDAAIISRATGPDAETNKNDIYETEASGEVAHDAEGKPIVLARWVAFENDEAAAPFVRDPNLALREDAAGKLQILVMMDSQNVTGDLLRSASAGFDQAGQPAVKFNFDSRGATRFGELTNNNLPQGDFYRHLAIILDNKIKSAPRINSTIYDSGEITGKFTQEETERLAAVLTAGRLPAALRHEPTSSKVIGPTLGADTIAKGVKSMLIATGVVIVFMLIYYRFAGIVANLAVVLNVLLTVAFMILFKAAFTLSGLAGLALTVGMAVDANVLIYERIREELSRGATLRMAIRNGFERATVTIIDANVTTLISAVVLYAIGTDQVKGFAVTLILGIVMNLFTAITVSRAIFDIAEKKRWIKTLTMMQMMTGSKYDFIGKRRIAFAISAIVIAVGMAGVVARGKGLLDIDFTGGVSVETLFQQPHDVADVRKKLEEHEDELPDLTVQDVHISGKTPGLRFLVITSLDDEAKVESVLQSIFKGELAYNQMKVGEVAAIPNTAPAEPADKKGTDKKDTDKKEADAKPAGGDGAALDVTPGENELALANFQNDEPPAKSDATDAPKAASKEEPAAKNTDDANAGGTKAADKQAGDDQSAPVEKRAEPKKSDEKKAAAKKAPAKKSTSKEGDDKKTDEKPTDAQKADDQKAAAKKAKADVPAAETEKLDDDKAATSTDTPKNRFGGGTKIDLDFGQAVSHDRLQKLVREALNAESATAGVAFDLSNDKYTPGEHKPYEHWELRVAAPSAAAQAAVERIGQHLADEPFFPSSDKIGSAVAKNTQQQAIVALVASIALIMAYVWFRFTQMIFGLSVIIALVHDVLVTLGALAVSYWLAPYLGFAGVEPFKINLPIIAAFLTIIGYSLNDTIVIFDRIREIRGKSPELTPELVNKSINQTLSRTLLTSLTVFLVVVILYAFGGQGIHGFAFALVIGTISGTYSTIYIATPALIWLSRSKSKKAGNSPGKARAAAL